jgi:two-component system response regulator DevR
MSSPEAKRVRVAIVDDSEVVRMGLRSLLSSEPGIAVVGEAGNVAGAADACIQNRADVALLDIRLPDGTGFDACRQILKRRPETRVVILTSVTGDSLVDEAIRAGAHGYLLKEVNGRALIQAVLDVAAGKSILDPTVTARVLELVKSGGSAAGEGAALASLSPQERRVLALIAQGRTNKEAGTELGLSEKTVKNYLSNIFEKLHVSRRAQAAAIFAQNPRKG